MKTISGLLIFLTFVLFSCGSGESDFADLYNGKDLEGWVLKNGTAPFTAEGDMIVGSYIPNVNVAFSIEALEDCEVSVADYTVIMSHVNKDKEITEIITKEFQKSNTQLQSRLVSLLNLNSVEKYELFLNEYPSLLNRIPHYYIANYLGITPTQLSRARKQFISKS